MVALIGLIGLAAAANQLPNRTPALLLGALSLGIAANFMTVVVQWAVGELSSRFSTSGQLAKALLQDIYEELRSIDQSPYSTGRFRYSYEHVIYSPKSMKAADRYITRFEKHLVESVVDDNTPYEAALLALFAGYNPKVAQCLERKFRDLSLPEFTRLADKAGSNVVFQQIVLTLALGKYFPGSATDMVRRLYECPHKIYYGDWIPHARKNLQQVALHASADEVLITYLVGNAFRPLEIFTKLDKQMERIDFYFIHPCIMSRQGLMALSAELLSPEILKREVGFLRTAAGSYQIDFVRKVFQILSNVHEITELALQAAGQDIRLFFFVGTLPSVCVQIVRDMGYLFLMPAAIDNAKFLCRFTMEVTDKEIAEQFVQLVDRDVLYRESLLEQIGSIQLSQTERQRFGGAVEQFDISKENLSSLCSQAIEELVVFLKAHTIDKADLQMVRTELILSVAADVTFVRSLSEQLLGLYDK